MTLSGMKCQHLRRLLRITGTTSAFCTNSSLWRHAVWEVRSSRMSTLAWSDHLLAGSQRSPCRLSAQMQKHPLPVAVFSVCGQSMWIYTRPSWSSAAALYHLSSADGRMLPSTARDQDSIRKKTLHTSGTHRLTDGKTQTCDVVQSSGMGTPDGLASNHSKTLPCRLTQNPRPLVPGRFGFRPPGRPGRREIMHRRHSTLSILHGQSAPVTRVDQRCYASDAHVKSVSALAVKRPLRKKAPKVSEEEVDQGDKVVGYAVAEELNLAQLKEALIVQGLYTICPLPIDAQDALHVQAKYTVDGKKREIFFFRDGSAVFWSMPEVERKEALKFIRKHDIGRYSPHLILREKEEMDLQFVKGLTGVKGDTLQLSESQDEGQSTLEKYAFSNALGQSVKLAIWEVSLETFVDSIEHVTEDLRDGQKIRMSRREVLRKTGELFALRHLINLSSDLLDTPDFYWDRAGLEPLYLAVYNHLDMTRRTKVMNEKLSHCCELTELLTEHLNDAHHTRLEVMIIVLILVEVVFEIVHYIERYMSVPESGDRPSTLPSDPATPSSVAPSSGAS